MPDRRLSRPLQLGGRNINTYGTKEAPNQSSGGSVAAVIASSRDIRGMELAGLQSDSVPFNVRIWSMYVSSYEMTIAFSVRRSSVGGRAIENRPLLAAISDERGRAATGASQRIRQSGNALSGHVEVR